MRLIRERRVVLFGSVREVAAVQDPILVFEEKLPDLVALRHGLALQVHQTGSRSTEAAG